MAHGYSSLQAGVPTFSLKDAHEIIIAALGDFDPMLGYKSQDIFSAGFICNTAPKNLWNDRDNYLNDVTLREQDALHLIRLEHGMRWRLAEVPRGEAFMMRCLPAQTPANKDGNPANPHPYAVIDYQFDHSLNGVIYLAHEVGHAIADDCIRAYGKSYCDCPHEIDEVQAYLPQLVVCDYLSHHQNKKISEAALQHRAQTFAEAGDNRGKALQAAQAILDVAHNRNNRREIIDALMGVRGPKTLPETLAISQHRAIQATKLVL